MRFEEVFPALRSGLAAKSRRGINPWRLDGHGLGKSEAFIDGKWHAMPIPVWLMCLDDWEAVADPVAPKCGDPCFVAGCRETCDKPRGARTDGHGELHGHGLHAWQFDYHRARAESERCPFSAIDCDQAKVNLQSTVVRLEARDGNGTTLADRHAALFDAHQECGGKMSRLERDLASSKATVEHILGQRDEAREGVILWCKQYEELEREAADAGALIRTLPDLTDHGITSIEREINRRALAFLDGKPWDRPVVPADHPTPSRPQDWPIEALREGNELRAKIDELRREATEREVSLSRQMDALREANVKIFNLEAALKATLECCVRPPPCWDRNPGELPHRCVFDKGHGGPNHGNPYGLWPKAAEPDAPAPAPAPVKVQG